MRTACLKYEHLNTPKRCVHLKSLPHALHHIITHMWVMQHTAYNSLCQLWLLAFKFVGGSTEKAQNLYVIPIRAFFVKCTEAGSISISNFQFLAQKAVLLIFPRKTKKVYRFSLYDKYFTWTSTFQMQWDKLNWYTLQTELFQPLRRQVVHV